MDRDWLTATEAATALGVKPATLYAYVSRGLVGSERLPGGRTSRYARADVERLAARQRRPGAELGGLDIVIETAITRLDPAGRLAYRGWDVVDAADAGFEVVAHWLWTGERREIDDLGDLPTPSALPPTPGVSGIDRVRIALAAVRGRDTLRDDHRPGAVAETGRTIVATMIAALPEQQPPLRQDTVAARLWSRLTARSARLRDLDLLDTVLVLLADHELAASTLAARVVASTWADPYLVVLAGLAALGGPLHGGASEAARALLREDDVRAAIGRGLDANELVPGFGHRVYRLRDPRAELLLDRIEMTPALTDALDEMRRRRLPFPNVDIAVAAFAEEHEMVADAGALMFAVARVGGWLAHAVEEYDHRLRFRPRAAYVGPSPSD
ncbi:MAG: citrate synthase [Actinomycetota bacterium]|jgi:citrate synthase|nr:citrate synthase [Actinomycetota bacterium]